MLYWIAAQLGFPHALNLIRYQTFRTGAAASRVHDVVREWERPSDHAPVTADFGL